MSFFPDAAFSRTRLLIPGLSPASQLSDIPAANQPQAVAAAFTAFQQQQQQSLQNLPTQLQQQLQQQFDLQNQMQKQKKVRKRKNGDNASSIMMTGSRSPAASSTGRSPKRKVSEDDFHPRDIEMLDARPVPGSNPGFDLTSGGPRSLEQLLSGMQNDPSNFLQHPNEIPNDLMMNLQLLQRSMSASAAGMDHQAEGMDFGPADFMAKLQGKKRTSRTRSSEEDELLKLQMGDVSAYPSLMRSSSVGPLPSQSQVGKGNKMFPVADSGRRCSSAGVGEMNRNRSPFASGNNISGEASLMPESPAKKDKKRKRSESVDSSMKSGASVSLMPPPLISSTGDVTTSLMMSQVADPASSALRTLTLNVKPMLPTSSSDPVQSPGASAKKVNVVSSSASVPSPRPIKVEKSKSLPKSPLDPSGAVNHMIVSAASGQSKVVKSGMKLSKNGAKIASAGPSGPKFKQGTGMRMKTSQVTSSSASFAKQTMSLSSPPVSSSSSTPGSVSPSVGSGVSSSKSGSQLLKLQLQQQIHQQKQQQLSNAVAAAAAAAAAVKKPKGSLSAVIDKLSKSVNPAVAPGESPSTSSPPPDDVSDASSAGPSSRPDSSCSERSSPLAKAAADKGKYSRPADNSLPSQTQYKAALSGIKLTISKKPTSTESKAGIKMKTTPAAPMKGSPASSSSSPSLGAKAKSTTLVKKHTVTGFKSGQKASSSVSSSSSSSLLSTPSKQNAGRPVGSGKVSSSGAGPSQVKDKISSSCGARAILEEALPRLRTDQLAKIPKKATPAAQVSAAGQPNAVPSLPTATSPPVSSQPSSSVTTPPVMAHGLKPLFRRPGPRPGDQQSLPASTSGSSVQLSDRFQSNAITSSHAQAPNQNQETLCSSSSLLSDVPQVPPVPGMVSASSSGSSSDAVGSSGNPEKGVSSSSDADPDEPTSTPSSPVESVVVSEANPPPIIPTESFDDNERSRIDSTGSRDPEISHSIYSADGTSGGNGKDSCCSSTSANAAADDGAEQSKDEEEDEDGLVIDVDYSVPTPTSNTPSSRKETPTPGDPVSSSNAPSSQPASGPSSPSSEKSPAAAAAESSSPTVTPSASSFPWSGSAAASAAAAGSADEVPAEASNLSPSPPVIDDDLMDEALVGSDEQDAPPVPVIPTHHVHEPEPEL
jgi:hypothetical protein